MFSGFRALSHGAAAATLSGLQTLWQDLYRANVDQLNNGMMLKGAVKFQGVSQTFGVPRDNH